MARPCFLTANENLTHRYDSYGAPSSSLGLLPWTTWCRNPDYYHWAVPSSWNSASSSASAPSLMHSLNFCFASFGLIQTNKTNFAAASQKYGSCSGLLGLRDCSVQIAEKLWQRTGRQLSRVGHPSDPEGFTSKSFFEICCDEPSFGLRLSHFTKQGRPLVRLGTWGNDLVDSLCPEVVISRDCLGCIKKNWAKCFGRRIDWHQLAILGSPSLLWNSPILKYCFLNDQNLNLKAFQLNFISFVFGSNFSNFGLYHFILKPFIGLHGITQTWPLLNFRLIIPRRRTI